MLQRLSIAAGAGLAAGILFAVMVKGTLLSFVLVWLAPLPLIIAALGWGLDIGALGGEIAAGIVVDGSDRAYVRRDFCIVSIALPAWLLSGAAVSLATALLLRAGRRQRQATRLVSRRRGSSPSPRLLSALIQATLRNGLDDHGLRRGYQKGVDAGRRLCSAAPRTSTTRLTA